MEDDILLLLPLQSLFSASAVCQAGRKVLVIRTETGRSARAQEEKDAGGYGQEGLGEAP